MHQFADIHKRTLLPAKSTGFAVFGRTARAESDAALERAPAEKIRRKSSCACGGGCPSCHSYSGDLTISQPNDAAEIEADQIADRVMSMPTGGASSGQGRGVEASHRRAPPMIHRKCDACEEGNEETSIQRKPLSAARSALSSGQGSHVRDALGSGGRPLDVETRGFFEPRFGYDLGSVRVHTDSSAARSAAALDSRAYTLGSDIVFGSGHFAPATHEGRSLLAHEIAHIVQGGASGKIHRKKRGGAAGCGVCLDPKEAGTIAHNEVRWAFAAANPELRADELAVPVVEEGLVPPFVPEVDLSYDKVSGSQRIIHIGEIKPLDDAGKQVEIARKKLKDYARELMANPALGYDEVFRMRDKPPPGPIPFFNPNHPPLCPRQVIHVQLTEPGIYQYYCEPPWSDLVRDIRCKCSKKKEEKDGERVLQKPATEEKKKEDTKQKKVEPATPPDETNVVPWVVAGGAGVTVSAATAAYLRQRAKEAAAKRAALLAEQALWRKTAEEAAKRRAAAAAGKGVAGKAAGKAVAYVEIAAAAALLILYPERVEAQVGPGPSPIESLYKAMTTNGTPPSPELKALIEGDPLLKQLAEEAGTTGDGSKLQDEVTRRTLQLIKDNPEMFSSEDLEFLTEYSKNATSSGRTPESAEKLREAIDAAKAGSKGGGEKGGKDADGETAAKEKAVKDAAEKAGDEGVKKLSDESRKKLKDASAPLSRLFKKFAAEKRMKEKVSDDFVKKFFEIVPPDLTDEQVQTLISRISQSPDQTPEQTLEALKNAVADLKKKSEESVGEPAEESAPAAEGVADGLSQDQLVAELRRIAGELSFKNSKKNIYRLQMNKEIIEIAKRESKGKGKVILDTVVFGKNMKDIGVVAFLRGSLPDNIDKITLKKGTQIKIDIISVSTFVDKDGNVYNIPLNGPIIIGL